MGVANFDVIVVGAGAAGLSAAIGLAKANFSVLVLEAGAFPGAENWSGCVYFAENLANPELLGPDGVEALAWERRLIERGLFSGDGHSFAGVIYRNPGTFRHCYTVLRPVFDHHLGEVARQAGATLLGSTTVEGLIRERGRVIGVSTSRGPLYADLVFLAEGDASHLVSKEGYERAATGRQDVHFLQGVKQVIEMPGGAIEEIFGVGPQEGVAYEMVLRNGWLRGRELTLNMGGFLYTNRNSISLGFVLPLKHLQHGFGGDPNLLIEWLRELPEVRRWTRGGTPGVFGAKLIRGGGERDIPRLIDHGLAIGGAASAIGVDFPYPNFTGPASGMGLLLARAAIEIRREGGSFTIDELDRYYQQPLQATHWYNDVKHLRRWPAYVEKTRYFFARNIDVVQGSLCCWTRPEIGLVARWNDWTRFMRRTLPLSSWGEAISDLRQMTQALGMPDVAGHRPFWRILVDGLVNSVRDLFGRTRPDIQPAGKLRWHFSVGGGQEPVGLLPSAVASWGNRLEPVLRSVAHELYRNEPVPVRDKLATIARRLTDQINLLDVLVVGGLGVLFLLTAGVQAVIDWMRRLVGRTGETAGFADRWASASCSAADYSRPPAIGLGTTTARPEDVDRWEDKLGRLNYEAGKRSHIKLFWPRDLSARLDVAEASVWHLCPAKVYECHLDSSGSVRLVVNYENCIKCESCWRASDLVDWSRDGRHRFIYPIASAATERLFEAQDLTVQQRSRPAKSRDWWSTSLIRLAQRTALSGTNGHFASELGRIDSLCARLDSKLREFDQAISSEPRTVDPSRARWIETLATYAKQLVEELAVAVRAAPLAETKDGGLREAQVAMQESASSLRAKMAEVARRAYDGHFFWAAADTRQVLGHHLEGLRRIVHLLRGRLAPAPLEQPASVRWLAADRTAENLATVREEFAGILDRALDPLAWRALDNGAPLTAQQCEALRGLGARIMATGASPVPERKVLLAELGRRVPSLGYVLASHFWARDMVRIVGGAAFEELAARLSNGEQTAAFAWDGVVEIDRDDEGIRLRGQKIFVPTALADWFVILVDDQLLALPRGTPGLCLEPLGTIGLRGSAPATLRFDNLALPATRRRIDREQAERLWAVVTALDLGAIACGMAERLEARAIEHATRRVQFPGLFLDDDFRESIGKFGAVKKMLAQIGARRYLLETLVHQVSAPDLSDESCRRALELKLAIDSAMHGHPGSITYNATQVFGGTGYSEEDILPMLYRDGSALLRLGVPSAEAAAVLGKALLRRHEEMAARNEQAAGAAGILVGLAESPLFDEAVQRKAFQAELDSLRRVSHEVDAAVLRWLAASVGDPQLQGLSEAVAGGLGQRQAELVCTQALVLRTHARLEAGLPAQLEIEFVRTWLQDAVDYAHLWVDWLSDPESHVPLPSIQPGPIRSQIQTSYQAILESPAPYQTGDYLVRPFDPMAPRYVPELVPFDPDLGPYDRELDELLRARYRDRLFQGQSYERHVEMSHRLDPEDFELFRQHGFLKMYVPRELGGVGASKAKYNLLIKNLIRNGDVGQTLTVQANTSIGTVPVLLGLYKELPKAKKELAEFRGQSRERDELAAAMSRVRAAAESQPFAQVEAVFRQVEKQIQQLVGSRASLRALCHNFLNAVSSASAAVRGFDTRGLLDHWAAAESAWHADLGRIDEFAEELERRTEALALFFRWIATGQMTAFALTEPSAGSDTARVATRAVPRSVEVLPELDGSYRFTPACGGPERRVIDARRLEFRGDAAFYRWSEGQEAARIQFDEYDYEADDSDQPRYFMAGPVKVPFHDIAQIRSRDGKLFYDYWELNGAKMWLTNARMCGVMVLYAKTEYGVTSFYVDRHAEGLLVGKNEEKMGQKASVTNELGLQAVRVPREHVNGLEGRGQVNALEALNAGRSGLTTSSATSIEDVLARAEQFARSRGDAMLPAVRHRLEEVAELRYMCESIAYELVVRADHRDTKSFRVEPSIGKMMTSELLMQAIRLCEDIYGLEGATTLHNIEKHKRDHRIITVYEGTNEIQRTVILKDLVREVLQREATGPAGASPAAAGGSDKLRSQRAVLEELKQDLRRVVREAVSAFGDEPLSNPNMQSVFFGLSDAAAAVKLADASIGRGEWVLRNLDPNQDVAYRDWTVRMVRRITARQRHQVRLRLSHVTQSMAALRRGLYPPQVRAASLMMSAEAELKPALPVPVHEISRAIQIVVVVEMDPVVSPRPCLVDGRWGEVQFRLDAADRAALAAARLIAAASTAPARVVVLGAGPRRAAVMLEEALALGADEAIQLLLDDRTVAPEPLARALARTIESCCRAPDLVLSRAPDPAGTPGLVGMLVAGELGLQFVPAARSLAVRFTEEEASVLAGSETPPRIQRLSLPAGLGIVAREDTAQFLCSDFLSALERPIRFVNWPEEITRRFLRLTGATGLRERRAETAAPARSLTPELAADLLLEKLGITGSEAELGLGTVRYSMGAVDKLEVQNGAVLLLAGTDSKGQLRAADRRAAHAASALARLQARPLSAMVFSSNVDDALGHAAPELAAVGASSITLVSLDEMPQPKTAAEFWTHVLMDQWSPEWSLFACVVAGVWAEPALARFGPRQAELILRVSELAPGPGTCLLRGSRRQAQVDAQRELPQDSPRPIWITVTDGVESNLPILHEVLEPQTVHWPVQLARLPSRRELMELLQQASGQTEVARLTEADFIIDVGFGIGSGDGFEEIVIPLQKLLLELGVPQVTLGASRKVTEELRVLPSSQQIGQTGQSVNPTVLLAIGISGAPQHLNYIGPRASIVAFNRDPEAPIMTLNQRQPQPRVFPVVGDLFQTIPLFMTALREHAQPSAEPRESMLTQR